MTDALTDLRAEKLILTAILSKPSNGIKKALSYVNADVFSDSNHRVIFTVMQNLFDDGRTFDLTSIGDALRMYAGEQCGTALETALTDMFATERGTFAQIDTYANTLRAASIRRKIYELCGQCQAKALDHVDADELLTDLRESLRNIATGKRTIMSMSDVMTATLNVIDEKRSGKRGILTGFAALDDATTGFQRGELTIIAARPAVGKSALAQHIAGNVARSGKRALFVSLEMSAEQFGTRNLLRNLRANSRVTSERLRTGMLNDDEAAEIHGLSDELSHVNVVFDFKSRTVEDLRACVQGEIDENGLDIVFVDYLQLLETKRRTNGDYERISHVSRALKLIAHDLGIPVCALSQVRRDADGVMPGLADLRGSGSIEQDADVVLFLHQPNDANDASVLSDDRAAFDSYRRKGLRYMAISIAKNRQGWTGNTALIFNPARSYFTDVIR